MALVEMVMPQMGESIMEGTILNWLKEVGDEVEQDEAVLEVATDKVDTEVPATHSGILKEILVQEGEVVAVGAPIALISTEAEVAVENTPQDISPKEEEEVLAVIEEGINQAQETVSNGAAQVNDNRFYSPLVMSIAKEENISMEELSYVKGTGADNRVTKNDILAYVKDKKQGKSLLRTQQQNSPQKTQGIPQTTLSPEVQVKQKPTQTISQASTFAQPASSLNGNTEIIEMDRMRKMIAERMVESKRISPHVTSFIEADLTNIVNWRNKIKNNFKQREGQSFTFTPIFIEAIAQALLEFPLVNISVERDKIILKKDINIGMATALPNNNLIVPVIKNADQLNLLGLAKKVNDLANRARNNQLKAEELSGGTYTMSNIGGFGNELGTPIIMQPQVAIMAFGAIKKKPAVIETPQGDFIGIRYMMFLSHAYDHRVVDGALGGKFVRKVADLLENFDVNRQI